MGEYIKYKQKEVKIGTLDNMYFVSFQKYEKAFKEGLLAQLPGNESPDKYIKPDAGSRFRFPFPDEDKLPFGDIGKFHYNRGIPVKIEPPKERGAKEQWQLIGGKDFRLEITQQKLVHREGDGKLCLALVVRNPDSGDSFRIEDDPYIRKIVQDIRRNHVVKTANDIERNFYLTIAGRIHEGFVLGLVNKKANHQWSTMKFHEPRRGKGLR